jgi:acyl-CoA synthetase (AMP-forming)/AMP-acid ligase II/acyl carrier protein
MVAEGEDWHAKGTRSHGCTATAHGDKGAGEECVSAAPRTLTEPSPFHAIDRTMAMNPDAARPLAAILERRAETPGDRWSITFLDSRGTEATRWNAEDLRARTRAIASYLVNVTRHGEPVLLVFHPGLDFLAAFMACLWTGRLATPINPPRRNRLIERLEAVATDSGAKIALSSGPLRESIDQWRGLSPTCAAIMWVAVDGLIEDCDLAPADASPDDLAFIQYTSGSTSSPKGVMVTHGNLVADMARMEAVWRLNGDSILVTWLPAFHDLGLIFGLLQPIFSGCATVLMAPNTFLQRPAAWLEALTRHRGTHTAAPGFAYDLCTRRIQAEEQAGLDLSSVVMAMIGAEPIAPTTMERFSHRFAACGFEHRAFAPAYGLAESTLAVTGSATGEPPVVAWLDAAALESNAAQYVDAGAPNAKATAGSGRLLPGVSVAIVDPETRRRCPPGGVAEIWVAGPIVARGYWKRPDDTAATFGLSIAGEDPAAGYLRTGDLGVLIGGELFVTGRIKDLIIVAGANHYPQDIERVAQASHPALRIDSGAAFSLATEDGAEQIVLVQELERTHRKTDAAAIFTTISACVWSELELALARITLVNPGAVLRTSSGKIQRRANRQAYLAGALPIIAEWRAGDWAAEDRAAAPGAAPAPDPGALTAWLVAWLAAELKIWPGAVRLDRGFAEMGLDSFGATQLAVDLGARLGRELPLTLAFDHPTPVRLIAHLAGPSAVATTWSAPTRRTQPSNSDLEDLLSAAERDEL